MTRKEPIAIIVNKRSRGGQGEEIFRKVLKVLDREEIPYSAHETRRKGDGAQLARTLCKSTFRSADDRVLNLIVIGGDGTINETVNGITDFSRVRMGVIETGSGNDFARELKIAGDPEVLAERILRDIEQHADPVCIDLGQVRYGEGKSRLYCISSGMGMDALATKLADRSRWKKVLNRLHMGNLIYILVTIKALFTMKTSPMTMDADGQESSCSKMIFTAFMNCKAEGGGIQMAPKADPTDGKLSLCLVKDVPKWKTFFYLPLLAMARHEKLKCFHFQNAAAVRIQLKHPMALHTDGEYLGDYKQAAFTCLPGQLRMIGLAEHDR